MKYFLGPWLFDARGPGWGPPAGTFGLRLAPPVGGVGLFWGGGALDPNEYTPVGDGDAREHRMSPVERAAWATLLGVPEPPSGATLVDAVWDALTVHADPEGQERARPIVPTHLGISELRLPGHSIVRARRFAGTTDPGWSRVQKLIQTRYAAMRERALLADPTSTLHSRYLWSMARKLGVPWEDLIPDGLPLEPPVRPQTVFAETWGCADDPNGINCDQTWLARASADMELLSNRASSIAAEDDLYQLDGDLSSDDHEMLLTLAAVTTTDPEDRTIAFARVEPVATTGWSDGNSYHFALRGRSSRVDGIAGVTESGTRTNLHAANGIIDPSAIPFPWGVRADGSSIEWLLDGAVWFDTTDTGVSGFVNAALSTNDNSTGTGNIKLSGAEAQDLAAPPAGDDFPHHQVSQPYMPATGVVGY